MKDISEPALTASLPQLTASQRAALAAMRRVVAARQPAALLTGKPGAGKTTVMKRFATAAEGAFDSGYIAAKPGMSAEELILAAFSEMAPGKGRAALKQFFDEAAGWAPPVLLIDEAGHLGDAVLAELMQLSGASGSGGPALRLRLIFACDEGEEGAIRAQAGAAPGADIRLDLLTRETAPGFLREFMKGAKEPRFSGEAVEELLRRSGGLPGEMVADCIACLHHLPDDAALITAEHIRAGAEKSRGGGALILTHPAGKRRNRSGARLTATATAGALIALAAASSTQDQMTGAQEPVTARITEALAQDEDARGLFRSGVAMMQEDAPLAIASLSRAALLGHDRAAYYLGQIYATGDGAPASTALAAAWYEKAGDGIDGAAILLAALPEISAGGRAAPPAPLYSARHPGGGAELVWMKGAGADAAEWRVEFAAERGGAPLAAQSTRLSALKTRAPESAAYWRVIALDESGEAISASSWFWLRPA